MAITNARKEKLSIYLARDSSMPDSYLVKTDKSKSPVKIDLADADSSMLYIKIEPPKKAPPWTRLFTSSKQIDESDFGISSSVGAAYVIRAHGNTFILTFGTGFHLLKSEAIERDFGLRVTLNSVDPDKLRSLDKASYDHNPLNSRTQSTLDVDIFNLHLDSEMEMLYAITGSSKVKEFGSHITGRDALTIAVEIDLNDLSRILKECRDRYEAKLPDKFNWVENVNRIRDQAEIEKLDVYLDTLLAAGDVSNFWLGEPEVVDWENQIGYSFDLYSKSPRHIVLTLENYINHLNGRALSVENLKQDIVHINDSEYRSIKSWPVYRCLYAEIDIDSNHYILRNGLWYKINNDFVQMVDDYLSDLGSYHFKFPAYSYDREEDYNESVAKTHPVFCLMDKKNIKIGGSYDKLEHCDLIHGGTDFVHVKYYRSSSTLSHLFSQGLVAAEAFIKDEKYRIELNPKLPASIQLTNPQTRPDPKKYRIVYAIATVKTIPKELPFFSKVTLKNAFKTLRALDYKVELARIEVEPALLVTKKYKPKTK